MNIISYFGNLYLHHFKRDVEEIKKHGFDTILICVTETDMLYSIDNIREMREYAEDAGLHTLAGPWGLAGIFGGEAISTVSYERDGLIKVREMINTWVNKMEQIGFKTIFLDEPHLGDNKMNIQFIKEIVNNYPNLKFGICLSDDRFDTMTDEEIKTLPVNMLGVSNYFWHERWEDIVQATNDRIKRLISLRKDNLVFIQGFDLPSVRSNLPFVIYEICDQLNVSNTGFWGFRCAEATSSKRAVDYTNIWNKMRVMKEEQKIFYDII